MSKFIRVTKIRSDRTEAASASLQPAQPSGADQFTDTDEPGENGVTLGDGRTVEQVDADNSGLLQTEPCMINVDAITSFYPRVSGRPGTRINFAHRSGFAVTESFDAVSAMVSGEQPVG